MEGYEKTEKTIYITNGQKVKNKKIPLIIFVVLVILTAVSSKINSVINLDSA